MTTLNMPTRKLLFTPGPATTTDSVKRALITEDMSPRDQYFVEKMQQLRRRITQIAADPERYSTVLLSSSGTGAVEAMLLAAARKPGKFLIIDNGAYGYRMREIASVYGISHEVWMSSPTEALDYSGLAQFLAEKGNQFSHIAVVHHETTTGLLNNISEIAALAKPHGIRLLVDAMSSFAAIETDIQHWQCDILASSANKNLQGMAGVAFVIMSNDLLDELDRYPANNFYLDVVSEYKAVAKNGQGRFTLPVQLLEALDQALYEFESETRVTRLLRYSQNWETLCQRLSQLGYQFLLPKSIQSQLLLSVLPPENSSFNFDEFSETLRRVGIVIYPGKLPGVNYFRLCTVGDLQPSDIQFTLTQMEKYGDFNTGNKLDSLQSKELEVV